MKERPILFQGRMIRTILSGQKTQTRRLLKHALPWAERFEKAPFKGYGVAPGWIQMTADENRQAGAGKCPYGVAGDRLWVRETGWYDVRAPQEVVIYDASPDLHKYKATGAVQKCDPETTIPYLEKHEFWKRRPSIFMRRWMSRITLEIESVRVERLQAITECDAKAEGIVSTCDDPATCPSCQGMTHRRGYNFLWNEINGPRGPHSWHGNPWVWVVAFRRL